MNVATQTCPNCSEAAPVGASWCEACGSDLSAAESVACISCGALEVSQDDYCMSCGHKQPSERDHQHFVDGPIVGASDRGKRHHHNEDAVAVGALAAGQVVAVVCDGVSSTPGSEHASLGAAIATRNRLVSGLNQGTSDPTELQALLVQAGADAQAHAAATPPGQRRTKADSGGPPSATFVACIALENGHGTIDLHVGWLGDSRAYWLDGPDSRLLTSDHALEGSLTRWIGADAPDPVPEVASATGSAGGRLLVCSDGLWRYAEEPAEMAALVERLERQNVPDIAEALITFANESGGHDNISVALWPTNIEKTKGDSE